MLKRKPKDTKTQIVGLTDYLIDMIPAWASFLLTLAVGIVSGVLGIWLLTGNLDPVSGTATGLFFIAVPAVLASALTTIASRASHKLLLKRSAYLGFFTTLVLASLYLTGSAFHSRGLYTVLDVMVYGYVLIFAMRVFILSVTCPYNIRQTTMLALIHPLIGLAFLINTKWLANFFPILQIGNISAPVLVEKALASSAVLAAGIALFIVLLNAPMKRAFGIKAFRLAKMFISHWYHGSMAVEEFLKAIGERVDTLVGVIAFRTKKGLKSVLIIPYVHPGPFGSVGGSRIVEQLTRAMEEETGVPIIVAHGTVTHDFDPVSKESVDRTIEETRKALKELTFNSKAGPMVRGKLGKATMSAQRFGNAILMTSSFSPYSGDDVDFAIGLNAMSKMRKGNDVPILLDAHNSHSKTARYVFSGDPTMFDIIDCVPTLREKIDASGNGKLSAGFASKKLGDYTPREGIGTEGVKALAVRTGNQLAAYVVFDANNLERGLREEIISALKDAGFDDAEVLTTDSHLVNSVKGVENPLGAKVPHEKVVRNAVETALAAAEDMEPVTSGGVMHKLTGIHVLGPQKTTQLTSTVNSMIAIMKIASPVIFTTTLILSLLSVLLIPWV
ncbi:DUF2070 family protein [Candidatus Micrarchaeota archaeon]|nr:DUF2070 family protein [Candidatus Micrarchaeota archaeon]